MNGQAHGHYTSEFVTRSLKFHLLKDYVLIHMDCTDVRTEVRSELFMASRDRLKDGDESRLLRDKLTQLLSKGRLAEIHKSRKAALTVESKDAEELVRNITRNLPIRNELAELLNQTFKIDDKRNGRRREKRLSSREASKENKRGAYHCSLSMVSERSLVLIGSEHVMAKRFESSACSSNCTVKFLTGIHARNSSAVRSRVFAPPGTSDRAVGRIAQRTRWRR